MKRIKEEQQKLSDKVSDVTGKVSLLYGEDGILELEGEFKQKAFCFFSKSSFWDRDQSTIRVGTFVKVNAVLVEPSQQLTYVPYIARNVWKEGTSLPSVLSLRLLTPLDPQDVSHYNDTVPGLQSLLPTTDQIAPEMMLGSTLVMQGIISEGPPVAKEQSNTQKRQQGVDKDAVHELQSRVEAHLVSTEKVKEKSKRRKSSSAEGPVKHLDCLHKLNDMIAELEKDVESDESDHEKKQEKKKKKKKRKAKVKEDVRPPEAIAYPQPGIAYSLSPQHQANYETSPHHIGFPDLSKLKKQSAWLGLTVAPGSVPTLIQPLIKTYDDTSPPPQFKDTDSDEEDSPIKKSIFTDIFDEKPRSPEHDEVPNSHKIIKSTVKDGKRTTEGVKLSSLLQKRLTKRGRSSIDDNYNSRTTKRSVERSRTKRHSRSRSRSNNIRQRRRSRSVEKLEKSKKRHVDDNLSKARSRSPHRERKERSRSKKRLKQKSKYDRSRSISLSDIKKKEKKGSRSKSKKRDHDSRHGSEVNTKCSKSSKDKRRQSTTEEAHQSENSKYVTDINMKETSEIENNNSDTTDDELIQLQKRRKSRNKILAKFSEDSKQNNSLLPSNKPSEELNQSSENITPISVFEQKDEETQGNSSLPIIVAFDAEVLHYSSHGTSILNFGAFAMSPERKSVSIFRFLENKLTNNIQHLISLSKTELMDCLRLKTSKFDLTSSSERMKLYFKHSDLGNVLAVKEKECLLELIHFLKSLNSKIIFFTHFKDSVLPHLFSSLSRHKMLDQFTALVSTTCDLVSLVWDLHMDQLWTGKQFPSLRCVSKAVCKNLDIDDGLLASDQTVSLLNKVLLSLVSEHKLTIGLDGSLVQQSGGQSVVEYMTVKYNLIQSSRELEDDDKPNYIEVVGGSEQWGKRVRIDLMWSAGEGSKSPIRESRSTPVPLPDINEEDDHVKILRQGSKNIIPSRNDMSRISWKEKCYKAFLPPGVVNVNQSKVLQLKVPALKPSTQQLLGKRALVSPLSEFTLCQVEKSISVISQPRDSMFPVVEATFVNNSKERVELDSRTINFAVATVRLESSCVI